MWEPNKAAEALLLNAYWSSKGWKDANHPDITAEQKAIATEAGYMFPPIAQDHDAKVKRVVAAVGAVTATKLSEAFATSLATRRLDLRSAFSSYTAMRHFRPHRAQPSGHQTCTICQDYGDARERDLNVLNFERFKWGGVRHFDPVYAWFDLTRFRASRPEPVQLEGFTLLRSLVDIAGSMPSNARANDLLKSIGAIVPGNANERRAVITALGYAGILQPASQPSVFKAFPIARPHPSDWKNDWGYPIRWWRGSDGVNEEALRAYFPQITF